MKLVHYHQQQQQQHIEGKVLHTTSSTTNRGKSHILGKNKKTKFQIQNKNISNIMSTSPIVTMTSKKIFVEIKISIIDYQIQI